MKKLKLLWTITLIGLSTARGQAVKDPALPNPVRVSTRVQMLVSLERASVKIGEPVRLHCHLKNVSSEVVHSGETAWSDDYWLVVTDASGAELPRTPLGDRKRRPARAAVHAIMIALDPGEERDEGVTNVAELYQLNRPGKYFVRIAFRLGPQPGDPWPPSTEEERLKGPREEAVSDLIPFTITP
jgi:hypothetical protein